ncbi:MAG TPA: hypothetical protein PK400_08155, partial [Phycisphaerales bacterium]|nr:hypothetical protein [Phycisphaerales bacterium]
MTPRPFAIRLQNLALSAIVASACVLAAGADELLLISSDLDIRSVRLLAIDAQGVHVLSEGSSRPESLAYEDSLALLSPVSRLRASTSAVVHLIDGQRFTGQPAINIAGNSDVLEWDHPLIGAVRLPLDEIESVIFKRGFGLPPLSPGAAAREADALLLTNGDVLTGFILSLNDPVSIEMETEGAPAREVRIPLARVASAAMVSSARAVRQHTGGRVWLFDGSIIDAQRIIVADDGLVRFDVTRRASASSSARVAVSDVAGILFDSSRLASLASLPPPQVEGPETRYTIPVPAATEPLAVLGLSPIEFRGPLLARYALPEGASRFAATALLPASSRQWGDYELVIRNDGREVWRGRLTGN